MKRIANPYSRRPAPSAAAGAASATRGNNNGNVAVKTTTTKLQRRQPATTMKNPYQRSSHSSSSVTAKAANSKVPHPKSAAAASAHNNNMVSKKMKSLEANNSAATFSQAFVSVEDTDHFQKSIADVDTPRTARRQKNRKEEEAQKQFQEALEMSTATTTTLEWSDRDHHVLLNQPHVLYVSTKQRGNGVLNFIRNVPYAFTTMVPDYIMGSTRCALFLSCKYHNLNKEYIYRRISELKTDFTVRVLLVLVDIDDNHKILRFLNTLAVTHSMTLILAWSEEEAARYLETFKAMDGKDATLIQRKEKNNFVEQASDYLTCTGSTSVAKSSIGHGYGSGVNKTDCVHLLTQFSNVRSIMNASMEELALVPGMGQVKVKRLHDAFNKPFSKFRARKRRKEQEEKQNEEKKKKQEQKQNREKHHLTERSNSGSEEESSKKEDIMVVREEKKSEKLNRTAASPGSNNDNE